MNLGTCCCSSVVGTLGSSVSTGVCTTVFVSLLGLRHVRTYTTNAPTITLKKANPREGLILKRKMIKVMAVIRKHVSLLDKLQFDDMFLSMYPEINVLSSF